jgi:hypothetical protein
MSLKLRMSYPSAVQLPQVAIRLATDIASGKRIGLRVGFELLLRYPGCTYTFASTDVMSVFDGASFTHFTFKKLPVEQINGLTLSQR